MIRYLIRRFKNVEAKQLELQANIESKKLHFPFIKDEKDCSTIEDELPDATTHELDKELFTPG